MLLLFSLFFLFLVLDCIADFQAADNHQAAIGDLGWGGVMFWDI